MMISNNSQALHRWFSTDKNIYLDCLCKLLVSMAVVNNQYSKFFSSISGSNCWYCCLKPGCDKCFWHWTWTVSMIAIDTASLQQCYKFSFEESVNLYSLLLILLIAFIIVWFRMLGKVMKIGLPKILMWWSRNAKIVFKQIIYINSLWNYSALGAHRLLIDLWNRVLLHSLNFFFCSIEPRPHLKLIFVTKFWYLIQSNMVKKKTDPNGQLHQSGFWITKKLEKPIFVENNSQTVRFSIGHESTG